jgi:hypothetical protein
MNTLRDIDGGSKMKEAISPEEFKDKMQQCIDCPDAEEGHVKADELMMEVLESLGYNEGVDLFRDNMKFFWYA